MTAPPLSRAVGRGRIYLHPETGDEHTSVTTQLKIIGNNALTNWAAKRVAEYAADNLDTISNLDRDAAIDVMKRSPWRDAGRAADIGTTVHAAIEARIRGETPPTEIDDLDAVTAAVEFLETLNPARVTPEITVFGEHNGVRWAGTCDALVRDTTGALIVVDWKNTTNPDHKGPYLEAGLQVAAYAAANEVAWLTNTPHQHWRMVPLTGVIEAWAVQLLPGGRYHAVEVLRGDAPRRSAPFAAFIAAATLKDAHYKLDKGRAWQTTINSTRDRQPTQ